LSEDGIIPGVLFTENDTHLPELNEVLPETGNHNWRFHGPCTGMSSRETWWAYFTLLCTQSTSDNDPWN